MGICVGQCLYGVKIRGRAPYDKTLRACTDVRVMRDTVGATDARVAGACSRRRHVGGDEGSNTLLRAAVSILVENRF